MEGVRNAARTLGTGALYFDCLNTSRCINGVVGAASISGSQRSYGRLLECCHGHRSTRRLQSTLVPEWLSGGKKNSNKSKMPLRVSSGRFLTEMSWEEGESKPVDVDEQKAIWKRVEQMTDLVREADALGANETKLAEGLSEQERAAKVREKLLDKAKQQAERRKEGEALFRIGRTAYEKGVYDKSVDILEEARAKIATTSQLGGEIQIWLALAYEAHSRHEDCLALLKRVENEHPMAALRRQAADTRYILDAPRLKISEDEIVKIPLIDSDYDSNWKDRSKKMRDWRRQKSKDPPKPDPLDDIWTTWKPPKLERNYYFWVAFSIWLTLLAIALFFQ